MSVVLHVQKEVPATDYISISAPTRAFHQVGGQFLEKMSVVTEIFNRVLEPLYGSQEKAIKQIRESTDRKCFLLYEDAVPVAVLVFKTVLSNEFEEFGVRNSIEIKSLFVDQSSQNSGRGLGSELVEHLQKEVNALGLHHSGIHVTVSDKKQESLAFFRKKNFQIMHEWKGKYKENSIEYLLSCPAIIKQAEEKRMADQDLTTTKISIGQPRSSSVGQPINLLRVIPNAHLDDIHALKKLSDGTFVSSSKDNSMYKWNINGERVRTVYEVEPTQRDERDWGTALQVLNDEYWVSGERSGRISLWKTNGTYVRDIQPKLPKTGTHISSPYNAQRITCFAKGLNSNKPSFFIGLPTMFDEFNFMENRTEFSTKVHGNDWVYAISPLTDKKILIVTGCKLDVWSKEHSRWHQSENLISEARQQHSRRGRTRAQRPFISSLVPLNNSKDHFGISVFDGSVKVIDIIQKTVIREWKEHVGRVWNVENITPQLVASSGEDRSIRLWDTRNNKSVHTIPNHIGQVSAMLSWDQHTLIAGTCPEDALSSNQAAEIRIYDVRR